MRRLTCLLALSLSTLMLALAANAQQAGKSPYTIEFGPGDVEMLAKDKEGRPGKFVSVKFYISIDKEAGNVGNEYKLAIAENGKRVKLVDLPTLTKVSTDLSVIIALDTSGSMKEHKRMEMARKAAHTFLDKLPKRADCGLVLFDHEIRKKMSPILDRKPILNEIDIIGPRGGTAFRDAAMAAIKMLSVVPPGKDRALVLLTDGADVNSTNSLEAVIAEAKQHRVRIFTIGIGSPGTLEVVTTALVLDRSGSMELPADDADLSTPKIKALHAAGAAFVNMMSETGRVSLIPFGSRVEAPRAFTSKKADLREKIAALTPGGETAMLDAVYTGICALEADGTNGRRAVVAMTDGIDNSSRRRVEEVIERAKDARIKLYLLGFGRKHEIDQLTMQRMADETEGKYYYAGNKDSLVQIFEELSIQLHDDGIDEATLTRMAKETGGAYYSAQDVSKLQFILDTLSQSIQREPYEVVFPSLNPRDDGTVSHISLRLIRVTGDLTDPLDSTDPGLEIGNVGVQRRGLIIAEMHPFIYVVLLAFLAGLIALPTVFRRPTA